MLDNKLEVSGMLIQGLAMTSINLKIMAGAEVDEIIGGIVPTDWYPLEKLTRLQDIIIKNYEDAGPIMEKIGAEMMSVWYHSGPGKDIIKKGVDFLHFQTGSKGYYSVIKGSPEEIGDFKLVEVDEKKGMAVIHSTTPFNKDMERGILIGGMKAPGDLAYVDVNNEEDKNHFNIKFH